MRAYFLTPNIKIVKKPMKLKVHEKCNHSTIDKYTIHDPNVWYCKVEMLISLYIHFKFRERNQRISILWHAREGKTNYSRVIRLLKKHLF